MDTFFRFYLVYCCLNFIRIIVYIIYTRLLLENFKNIGIKVPSSVLYSIWGYFFANFISFTAFSYAVLALNHLALLLYIYITTFRLLWSALIIPFSVNPYLILGFLAPTITEIFYVLKNFNLYARKIIFNRNKKVGSNLKLKNGLNIRSMEIVSRLVAYAYIYRLVFADIVTEVKFKNSSYYNNYILHSLIGIELCCSFYKKYENIILKTISWVCTLGLCIFMLLVNVIKWRSNKA